MMVVISHSMTGFFVRFSHSAFTADPPLLKAAPRLLEYLHQKDRCLCIPWTFSENSKYLDRGGAKPTWSFQHRSLLAKEITQNEFQLSSKIGIRVKATFMAGIIAVSSGLVLAPEPVLVSDVPRKGFNRRIPSSLHSLCLSINQLVKSNAFLLNNASKKPPQNI